MPSQEVPEMLAFPLETHWLTNPSLYILLYLSKVINQLTKTPTASFWCKRTNGLLAAFKLFKWNESRGKLLDYDEQTQAFASHVWGTTAHGVRILPDDINALRSSLSNKWNSQILSIPVMAIVADIVHIKDDLLRNIELKANEAGFSVRIIYTYADANSWAEALSGVSCIVLSTSEKITTSPSWAWLWLAPKGCKILELQEEREPSDNLVHLAAAAGLEWTLLQYPRSTPDGFKKIVLNELTKWLTVETTVTLLPAIYTPPISMKYGFFGHKGDSFREMIDMWAEKGYIERKEDPSLTHCWLNSVGHTLLYDRPTWAWLDKAPEKEKTYKVCLTGNPDPSEKSNAKPWVFWPRQPRLVEKASLTQLTYKDRSDTLVFFGRIENQVQGQYRQDISGWKSICSKFTMQEGAKEAYSLNPEEYLQALSKSKYGLCLRGYGPKCNREIELLALGTVPVVVSGVDTMNYAEPLIDGIHILCVSDSNDAQRKINSISESEWETMSKAGHMWWKRNASVDGAWARTKGYLA
jgi:hypothetical protein